MNCKEILRTVDTEKALSLIGIKFDSEGSYAKFACPQLDCEGKVAIKEYCERKIFLLPEMQIKRTHYLFSYENKRR